MDKQLIRKIVKAFEIKPGELVLLQFWGEEEDRKVLHEFSYELTEEGATPLEMQHSRAFYKNLFERMDKLIFDDKYFTIFQNVDVVIDICMYTPVLPHKNFSSDKMGLYREYMQKLFQILMGKEKFIQLRVPTQANALEAGLAPEVFISHMTAAYDIDYGRQKAEAAALIQELKFKESVVITTGNDCELTLDIRERKWYSDTGTGDMPCGEIYIAPAEYVSEGKLYMDRLYLEDIYLDNVTLVFQEGKLTDSDSDAVKEYLKTLPENGNVLCEFGIGMNENVKELCGYTVLDEKMKNSYHVAIGANNMFGGNIASKSHIDFVFQGDVVFK